MQLRSVIRVVASKHLEPCDNRHSTRIVEDNQVSSGSATRLHCYGKSSSSHVTDHTVVGVPNPLIAGRYIVQGILGEPGAQGEVYQALDTHEGDVVAIKLLTSRPAGGPWMEAQILRRLADPHVLPIRNADQDSGRPYLVTELARHGTLATALKATGTSGLDVDDVVRWIRHACHGVARAHDLRLLHNDLKPANLFLNAQGECLVGDFGVATLIPPTASTVCPYGATAETVSPEVASGWGTPAATASTQSDVYSLGATAFWLLAARPPHDLAGLDNVAAKMAVVASETPPKLRDLAPHLPPYVSDVIEKATARNSSDRYPTVMSLAAALGTRPISTRHWRRTDEHGGHLACWRGEPRGSGSTYVLCVEPGPRPAQCVITAMHAASGIRISRACSTAYSRNWSQAVRASIRKLR
jgi:serine/threonine protein kinase